MNISDRDFDKVVAGTAGGSEPEASELSRIMGQLNSAYVSPIPPATEAKHLHAIQQANAGRTCGPAKTPAAGGFVSVLEPLRALGAGLRGFGFVHLSGSTAVWAVVVALFLVSTTGGLAAAGVLPERIQSAVSHAAKTVGIDVPDPVSPDPAVQVADPPGSFKVSVSVAEGDAAAQQAALASAEQAIAAAEQAQKAAQEAAAASARCMEESMAKISSLVDGMLGATSQAQAQAMVNQARNIGSSVKVCSDQAAAIGRSGVAYASQAAQLAQKASEGDPAMGAQALASVHMAETAARIAETSAGRAMDESRSIVDNMSGLAASLVNSTIVLQQPVPPPVPPAAETPASLPARSAANQQAWAGWEVEYADQVMRSFKGGAQRGRGR